MSELFTCKTFRQAIGIAEAIAKTNKDAAQAYLNGYHKRNNVEFAALSGMHPALGATLADSWVVREIGQRDKKK